MNSDRVRVRKMWDLVTAIQLANNKLEVPQQWSTHLTETKEEALAFYRQQTLSDLMRQAKQSG